MNFKITENENIRYIEIFSVIPPIRTEQDALELVSLCGDNETNQLIIHREVLAEDFFKLKTGVAGAVMQKLINYSVKAAIIIPEQDEFDIRFRELALEANKGSQYRFFKSTAEAENWFKNGV